MIDDTRNLLDRFALTPVDGGWRIVVIDGVEHLSLNAQNALLKLLEEPPTRSIFIMTTAAPHRIRKTIRSRCVRISLLPLTDGELSNGLQRLTGLRDPCRIQEVIAASEGSLRTALRLHTAVQSLKDNSTAGADRGGFDGPGSLDGIQAVIRRRIAAVAHPKTTLNDHAGIKSVAEAYDIWGMALLISTRAKQLNLDPHQLTVELEELSAS